jgi:hypothetical protein
VGINQRGLMQCIDVGPDLAGADLEIDHQVLRFLLLGMSYPIAGRANAPGKAL